MAIQIALNVLEPTTQDAELGFCKDQKLPFKRRRELDSQARTYSSSNAFD